ncbi:transposase [Streptomyces sp. NBC_00047]|uniref:transposase n=1 Tax=Streptomyces sp. NBC_00047 TaxID=2975627 RepID=UPI002B1DF4F2|nr:transposase [Streptomyces sp. NBC_00047]
MRDAVPAPLAGWAGPQNGACGAVHDDHGSDGVLLVLAGDEPPPVLAAGAGPADPDLGAVGDPGLPMAPRWSMTSARVRSRMPGAMFPALERALVLTGTGPLVLLDGYQSPAAIRRMGTARLTRWLRARGVRSSEELATTAVEADFLAEVGSDLTFFRTADRPTAFAGLAPVPHDSGKKSGYTEPPVTASPASWPRSSTSLRPPSTGSASPVQGLLFGCRRRAGGPPHARRGDTHDGPLDLADQWPGPVLTPPGHGCRVEQLPGAGHARQHHPARNAIRRGDSTLHSGIEAGKSGGNLLIESEPPERESAKA